MIPQTRFTKEEHFWHWFSDNRERVLRVAEDQSVMAEIATNLQSIYPNFTFEIGQCAEGIYEFVISCGGINEGIPWVERLASFAPEYDNIKIVKFRQAKGCDFGVNFDGIKLGPDNVWFRYCYNELIHLQLFIPEYKQEDKRFLQMAFLLLDNILGEYFVMTRIGHLDLHNLDEVTDKSSLKKLIKLPDLVKAMMN